MTCAMEDPGAAFEALGGLSDGPIPAPLLAQEANIARWLMRAAAADGGRTIRTRVEAPPAASTADAEKREALPEAEPEAVRALAERLSWSYPAAAAEDIPSKLTATGIGRLGEPADAESAYIGSAGAASYRLRRPELCRGDDAPLTGADRGVAEHLAMQYIDFARVGSEEEIREEIARLRERGFLDERQAASVPPEDIRAFFTSPLGRRVLTADKVLREFRFSLLCPAERWFSGAPAGEEVLLQGVVDCCIEENGVLTVVDFKTDGHIDPERYTAQLEAYALAMERITGKPVRGAVLWYLRLRQAVPVPLPEKSVAISNKV